MKIDEITVKLIEAITAAHIEYMLVGSFSSNFYGIARSTQDADFVIQLEGKSISCIQPHLGNQFKLDPQMAFETATGTTKNVVSVKGTNFQIELFRLSDELHDQERFRRRRAVKMLGREVYLPTAEDVVVTKLRWFRRKDYDDIQNVIAVQGNSLDWSYIHAWCEQHRTRDRLDQIRSTLPPIDPDDESASPAE